MSLSSLKQQQSKKLERVFLLPLHARRCSIGREHTSTCVRVCAALTSLKDLSDNPFEVWDLAGPICVSCSAWRGSHPQLIPRPSEVSVVEQVRCVAWAEGVPSIDLDAEICVVLAQHEGQTM